MRSLQNATFSLAVAALVFAVVAPSGRSSLSFCVELLVGCHFDVGFVFIVWFLLRHVLESNETHVKGMRNQYAWCQACFVTYMAIRWDVVSCFSCWHRDDKQYKTTNNELNWNFVQRFGPDEELVITRIAFRRVPVNWLAQALRVQACGTVAKSD